MSTLAAIHLGEPGATSVLVGYAIAFGVIGAYSARLISRARRLGRGVPSDRKPWT